MSHESWAINIYDSSRVDIRNVSTIKLVVVDDPVDQKVSLVDWYAELIRKLT